jgi:putative chitinase
MEVQRSRVYPDYFKDNYRLCAKEFGKTLDDVVDWLETPAGASWSAAYFWHRNAINTIADKPETWKGSRGSFQGLDPFSFTCVMVNGGLTGFVDRREHYKRMSKILI